MQAKEALEKMNLPRDFRGPRKILQIWITRRCNLACFNCLAIDTRFITRNGVRSFKDFKDGDSTTVLTHAGNWKHAIVRNYGKKKVYPITFVRGKTKITVKATADHRWLLLNGDVVEGVEHGDRLIKAPMPAAKWNYDNVDPMEKLMWCYGYIYGDGTVIRKNTNYTSSMVRLCGKKAIKFTYRFKEMGFSTSNDLPVDGDVFCYTGNYLKTLPENYKNLNYLRAFVRGWLDADGEKIPDNNSNVNEFKTIQVTGHESIDFIRRVFPLVGVYIVSETDLTKQVTNYGKRTGTTIRFGLLINTGESHNSHFTVNNIGNTGKTQSVWCLEVEDDHSFVLPSGLVTGNCTQGSNYRGGYQDMTPDQFRTACLSLKDYPGVTALFGGNPCIHKQFEDICAIARELIPWNRRGIWTNALLGKGKVCRETFNPNMSNFNVHLDKKAEEEFKRDWPEAIHLKSNTHDSRHAPVFISMKDLDKLRFPDGSIKDNTEENRWELITTCDINKHWSAMVGVFRGQLRGWFCEIAGAQSILKQDNPSYPDTGLEISPGWWRKGLEAFAPQIIQHCHNCGVPLRGHGALAVEGDKDGSAEQCSETYINVCQPKKSGRPVHLVEHIEDLGKKVPHVTDYLANYKL